jgi:hypothetical protein
VDVLFIHAQSVIRADGPPSAQVRTPQLDASSCLRSSMSAGGRCALARANPVFGTDEKRIRTKNTVIDKDRDGVGLVFIRDRRLRTDGFSSVRNR